MATRQPRVGAGVAGASSGTGLLAVVQGFVPEHSPWKPVLTYVCPTVSVASGAAYLYVAQYISERIAETRLDGEISKAEKALASIDADPGSSTKTKDDARIKLDALRTLKMELHTKRAKAIVNS